MNRVLIGCEESGVISQAFRDRHPDWDVWSCDLQPTRGNANYHIQGDVIEAIKLKWDLIILHPDCTAMAVSGNRWYGKDMPMNQKRIDSIIWTKALWKLALENAKHVALENPVSVIFSHLDADVQYIQPWEYGHGETKKTGFALHSLPPLVPTNIVSGREQRVWKMAPSPNRKRDRSKTFQGVADAISQQWGAYISNN